MESYSKAATCAAKQVRFAGLVLVMKSLAEYRAGTRTEKRDAKIPSAVPATDAMTC
jgi:hypothetical protein